MVYNKKIYEKLAKDRNAFLKKIITREIDLGKQDLKKKVAKRIEEKPEKESKNTEEKRNDF